MKGIFLLILLIMKKIVSSDHKWSFFKAGGVFQANISCGADIANIASLDQTLWAALACPTKGICFDKKTLDLLDTDCDGRIRTPEVVAACEWTCAHLKDADKLLQSPKFLALDDIDTSSDEGSALQSCAEEIVKNLGKESALLSPSDFDDETKIFAHSVFNADGVVIEDAAEDESVKRAMRTIISVMGSTLDRSGKDGVSEAAISEFYEHLAAYKAWKSKAGAEALPFGDDSEAMFAAFSAIEKKLDEYFEFARILSYDESSENSINASAEKFEKILGKENEPAGLSTLPLARVKPMPALDLTAGINPCWIGAFNVFKAQVVAKIFPDADELKECEWQEIKNRFAAYGAWLAQKDDRGVSEIPADDVENLSKPEIRTALEELIAKDWAMKENVENIAKLGKLVRFNSYLYELLTNFVNFKSFYKRDTTAIFQVGRLFFDQRECDLCISVDDDAKHASLSAMSYLYLVYCTCTRPGEAPINIAAAITQGEADNIQAGRNGLFYDREGRDWDANVTKVVTNPISIRQAFWSPYKRALAWASEQIAKRAAAADTCATDKLTSNMENAGSLASDPKNAKKIDIGTVAALGVAVGGLTTAFAVIMANLKGMPLWNFPLIIVCAMLLISLPSMIIAAMKLRLRNLAPLLDANMWAVNTRTKLNFKLGSCLTRAAAIPFGAPTEGDPFEDKKPYGKIFLAALILGAIAVGAAYCMYNNSKQSVKVEQKTEAEAKPEAEAAQ